tara:strand:- start:324 stop:686 length:363 start_codon:yes stop_codon:yes gene_type:complete
MASRGKGARIKGANFERDLAKYFNSHFHQMNAKRGLGQTRGGGEEIADVEMQYIHVEAKRHKKCNIKGALNQAIEDSKDKTKLPVAITKDDRKPILVTMLMDDWIELFKAYVNLQESKNT